MAFCTESLRARAAAPITAASVQADAERTARAYNAAHARALAGAAVDHATSGAPFSICAYCGWPEDHAAFAAFWGLDTAPNG